MKNKNQNKYNEFRKLEVPIKREEKIGFRLIQEKVIKNVIYYTLLRINEIVREM